MGTNTRFGCHKLLVGLVRRGDGKSHGTGDLWSWGGIFYSVFSDRFECSIPDGCLPLVKWCTTWSYKVWVSTPGLGYQ
jgi:hypothetical protein